MNWLILDSANSSFIYIVNLNTVTSVNLRIECEKSVHMRYFDEINALELPYVRINNGNT